MTTFSAAPQAIGYLYQARVALSMLLEASDDAILRVESLDDIEIQQAVDGGSLALVQLKHHTTAVTLSDASVDLWKSLRVWSEQAAESKFSLTTSRILLLTTATITLGSIPSLLGLKGRDIAEAEKRLLDVANNSSNAQLTAAFAAFKALNSGQRKALLACITIVPNSPDIDAIRLKISQQLRVAVRANHLVPFVERVEGWWFDKVILHLLAKTANYKDGISAFELHEQAAQIAESFHDENLPIDFLELDLSAEEIAASSGKQYVSQLNAINAGTRTVRKAVVDYHRAYHQRHRWLIDGLVLADELEKFEVRLVDEWERYFDHNFAELNMEDQQALLEAGRNVLRWAELECQLRIRALVEADYIRRGSFHMLADRSPPGVCWHPRFAQLMEDGLKAAA